MYKYNKNTELGVKQLEQPVEKIKCVWRESWYIGTMGGFLIPFSVEMNVLELQSEYSIHLGSKLSMYLRRVIYSSPLCCVIAIDKHKMEMWLEFPPAWRDLSPAFQDARWVPYCCIPENNCPSRGSSFMGAAWSGILCCQEFKNVNKHMQDGVVKLTEKLLGCPHLFKVHLMESYNGG